MSARKGLLSFCVLLAMHGPAQAREVTLKEVIELAEQNDHSLSAAEFRAAAQTEKVGVARSAYYPTLDLEALYSTGFPGSSGLVGVGGLMGSPYRSGPAVGLVAKETVWDFGRTSAGVEVSRQEAGAETEGIRLTRYQIDWQAAQAFFECARYRSQRDNWNFVLAQARSLANEVRRFVSTGQRSVVERYLADSQVEEALTAQADFENRMRLTLRRIGIATGHPLPEDALCPGVQSLVKDSNPGAPASGSHPAIARAEAEARAAEARVNAARADYLPRVVAVGSIGSMESSRLVAKNDYAVGVGLVFPLFSGFRTSHEVSGARAAATEKEFEVQAAREHVDVANARYDEVISAARARLEHLRNELALAEQGFSVASRRYGSLKGTLVDVREALRNLGRTRTQIDDSQADFLQASVAKILFNGGKIQ